MKCIWLIKLKVFLDTQSLIIIGIKWILFSYLSESLYRSLCTDRPLTASFLNMGLSNHGLRQEIVVYDDGLLLWHIHCSKFKQETTKKDKGYFKFL